MTRLSATTLVVCAAAVTAASVRTQAQQTRPPTIRFEAMDTNGDRVISRAEWRGSPRSFEVHDWNGDGRLSGDEVRIGANFPGRQGARPEEFNDWSQDRFRWLDTNGDGRLSRSEWRYEYEDFFRVDRNRDGAVTAREFMIAAEEDDDRGDPFSALDHNNDGRLDRTEWHGSLATFRWLDNNGDGILNRAEVTGSETLGASPAEKRVIESTGTTGGGAAGSARTVIVSANRAWTDTGIDVRRGDIISVTATGQIMFAPGARAEASGGAGNATSAAPRPDLPIGALIGRIGNGETFMVGATLNSMRATTAGRLFLGTNDDILNDNSGQFRVVVNVGR